MHAEGTTVAARPGTPARMGGYDTVVVGGGSAGAVLARRLSERVGRRVLLLEGIRMARRIGRTAPLSDLIETEIAPGPEAESDEAILASVRATLDTYHHPTSTVRMGSGDNPDAVVGLDGRVLGVAGLSVIDASIFPDAISVATNVTTIAVAEHLSARLN